MYLAVCLGVDRSRRVAGLLHEGKAKNRENGPVFDGTEFAKVRVAAG